MLVPDFPRFLRQSPEAFGLVPAGFRDRAVLFRA